MLYQEFDPAFNSLYLCFLKTFIQREKTLRHHIAMSVCKRKKKDV